MGKRYFCDRCGKEVSCLFDLCRADGNTLSVCKACYYGTETKDLCSKELAECQDCKTCN